MKSWVPVTFLFCVFFPQKKVFLYEFANYITSSIFCTPPQKKIFKSSKYAWQGTSQGMKKPTFFRSYNFFFKQPTNMRIIIVWIVSQINSAQMENSNTIGEDVIWCVNGTYHAPISLSIGFRFDWFPICLWVRVPSPTFVVEALDKLSRARDTSPKHFL